MKQPAPLERLDPRWNGLYRSGAIAAFAMLAIMITQVVIFAAWPPPGSVEGFFALFQQNWLLGLLSLDLLYLVNNALLIVVYLAIYAALKRQAESAMLVSLVLGLVGIAAYYASNTAFEIFSLSRQYAAADEAGKAVFFAAAQAMLEIYKGTAFDAYYILNAAALLIFSGVMLRSRLFDRTTAWIGLAAGVLMAIPSTAGMLGMVFSLASLVPWAVFSIRVALRLLRETSAAGR